MLGRILWLVIFCFATMVGHAEEVVTIPLDQILALDMPGTRNIDQLFPEWEPDSGRRARIARVRRTLTLEQPTEKPGTGFVVVAGEGGPNGLDDAQRVLRSLRRSNSVPVQEEICIIFFSYASPYRIQLEKVDRQDSVINIRYRLVPHRSSDPSNKTAVDLALIPLGKLPAGNYRVEMTRSPMARKDLDAGFERVSDEQASRFVCQPFSFEVWNLPEPDPGLSENAIEIPLDQIWASNTPGTRDIRQGLDWEQLPQQFFALSTGSLELLERLGKNKAEPGFAVAGTGQEALAAAHKKLPEGEEPSSSIPFGTEISVVYFSHGFAPYIHLRRVERLGNVINVRYRFDPTGQDNFSNHLALIPLGKLPVGAYRVNVIETPSEEYLGPPSVLVETHLRVCQSFTFFVEDGNERVDSSNR